MTFELKLALRFIRSGKSQTIFIVVGIAIGVAVQIFLGSLITSLQDNLVDETIGNSAHISIRSEEDTATRILAEMDPQETLLRGRATTGRKNLDNWGLLIDQIEDDAAVSAISPSLQGTALVRSGGTDTSVQVKGILLEDADPIYQIKDRMVAGNSTVEGNSVLIGATLAADLGVEPGGNLNLMLPNGEMVRLLVGGTFDLQNEASNKSLIFMDLRRAQKLFGTGDGITAIEVQVEDPFVADEIAAGWSDRLSGVEIQQWKQLNEQLLTALSSQSSSSYTIQFFVIISITFGIASVLAVSVVQKSKEIGILKAMGTTKRSASKIFILQGFFLGLLGSVVGTGLGILLLTAFNSADGLTFLIAYRWSNILLLAVIATAAGTLASVLPARRSANLNPMEAIKNG